MDTRSLLDQLLKAAPGLLGNAGKPAKAHKDERPAGKDGGLGSLLSGAAGGGLAAGAIGLLLGSKKARKYGGKALAYGGLAALGVMAYKAYSNWQQQQGAAQAGGAPQTVDRLPPPQAEQHSHAILRALIAAAKADGHIDERERQLIDAEVARLSGDPQLLQWLDSELHQPLDPVAVARAAQTPEMAAEMFLASLLVIDEQSFMERAYLDELARQLRLDPALRGELEQQVRQAQ
jgi:uncharacterized membrane protein YebE (DUF533 family)